MKKTFTAFAFIVLLAGLLSANTDIAHAQSSGFRVIKNLRIPGSGRWDYIAVCPVNDNIYVAHQDHVDIINKNTGDSTGIIPNTEGIHGIAFATELNKGFTSNGKLNTVSVFDIRTNAVLAQIKTGENPDAIMYDPYSKNIFVCNGHGKSVSVIDPVKNEVIHTIELGGKPETAVSGEDGNIYINIEDKSELVVINTDSYKIKHRWTTGKGESPSGLAIDTKTKRLFSGCENKLLIVVNAENGKVVKELPIGNGCDGVAFDPETKNIFSANGEGTLTVINETAANDFSAPETIITKKSARTLAVDPGNHNVYMPAADFVKTGKEEAQKRPDIAPGTFQVLVVGR